MAAPMSVQEDDSENDESLFAAGTSSIFSSLLAGLLSHICSCLRQTCLYANALWQYEHTKHVSFSCTARTCFVRLLFYTEREDNLARLATPRRTVVKTAEHTIGGGPSFTTALQGYHSALPAS